MNIIDRIILTIYTFCFAILSIALILLPFEEIDFLSVNNVENYLIQIKGNYVYSIIGLAFLLVSIRFLISGLTGNKDKNKGTFLVRHTDYGELKISTQTIEGLAQSVANKFTGIRNIITKVYILEGIITLHMRGEVSPEINIPETTIQLQNKVKEHVEKCTGVEVSEVKVEISNVTAPTRTVK